MKKRSRQCYTVHWDTGRAFAEKSYLRRYEQNDICGKKTVIGKKHNIGIYYIT